MGGADGIVPAGDDGGSSREPYVPAAVFAALDLLEQYCQERVEDLRAEAMDNLYDLRQIVTAAGGQWEARGKEADDATQLKPPDARRTGCPLVPGDLGDRAAPS